MNSFKSNLLLAAVIIGAFFAITPLAHSNMAEDCFGPMCNAGGYNMGDGFDTFGTNNSDEGYTNLPGVTIGGSNSNPCNDPSCLPEVTLIPTKPATLSPFAFPGHFINFAILPPVTSIDPGTSPFTNGSEHHTKDENYLSCGYRPGTEFNSSGAVYYFESGSSIMMSTYVYVKGTTLSLKSNCDYQNARLDNAGYILTCRNGNWYDETITSSIDRYGAGAMTGTNGDFLHNFHHILEAADEFIVGVPTPNQVSEYLSGPQYRTGYKLSKYCAGPSNKNIAPGTRAVQYGCYPYDGSNVSTTTEGATDYAAADDPDYNHYETGLATGEFVICH